MITVNGSKPLHSKTVFVSSNIEKRGRLPIIGTVLYKIVELYIKQVS